MALLDDDDVAYMRETQTGTRPTSAELFRRTRGRDGLGGSTDTWPGPGIPVDVRVKRAADNSSSDEVPQNLADKYDATQMAKVVMDLVPCSEGDRLHDVDRDRWYQVVSDGSTEEWSTAQRVWVVRIVS